MPHINRFSMLAATLYIALSASRVCSWDDSPRSWTVETGGRVITASLVCFNRYAVKLRGQDGQTIEFAVVDLSEEDREYLARHPKFANTNYDPREWRDVTGEFSVVARLAGVQDDKVVLKKLNLQEITRWSVRNSSNLIVHPNRITSG